MGFGPSPEQIEWQNEHRDETRRPGIIAACAATAAVSFIIMALRLYSRRLLHKRLRLDASDWLILVAWVFLIMKSITWAVGTVYGIGRHSVVVTDFRIVQILAIAGEVAYVLAVAFIKFSVLSFYTKTFPSQKFRYLIWAVTFFVAGWAMSSAMVAIFQCNPIDYVWRPDVEGFCIDLGIKNLIAGITNVLSDVFIIAMVIPLVWNMDLTTREKRLMGFAFAIGGSACVVSIIRLPFSTKVGTSDGTWAGVPTVIISLIEITVGLLAGSIPTYQPLFEHLFGSGPKKPSNLTIRASNYYKEALNMTLYGHGARNDVNVTSPGLHIGSEHRGGINVTNHIELIRHTNKSGSWVRVIEEDEEALCKPDVELSPLQH